MDLSYEFGLLYVVLLIFGIIIGLGYYFWNKKRKQEPSIIADNSVSKKVIDQFILNIKNDYEKEYKHNFLSIRYDIDIYKTDKSYIFKTKYISGLSELFNSNDEIIEGEKYLVKLISDKYNISIGPVFNQLLFITDVSRIEGKIMAVENVKSYLDNKDYISLLDKFQSQKNDLLEKYSNR